MLTWRGLPPLPEGVVQVQVTDEEDLAGPLLRLQEEEAGVLPGAVRQVARCQGGTQAVLGEREGERGVGG